MAAATVLATGANLNPKRVPFGVYAIPLDGITIESTSVDDANDRANLAAVLAGHTIEYLIGLTSGDGDGHATPTLDMDLVISEGGDGPEDDGTETILYNAGTAFQAAVTDTGSCRRIGHTVSDSVDGIGYIRSKVNTGAATEQDVALGGFFLVSAP